MYRRHDSRASLVARALLEILEELNPAAPDTGDVIAHITDLLSRLAVALTSTAFGPAVIEIVSPAAHETHLAELFDTAIKQRRELIKMVMVRAEGEGRLVATDVETAIDMALGAVYFRHLFTHGPIDGNFIATIVAALIQSRSASN